MEKKAQASATKLYPYPIENVFRVIVESIIKQMQGPGKKNNLNYINPLGKTSDYTIIRGKRALPVHFEITTFQRPHRFTYIMNYNNTRTEQEWILEDYDAYTTNVTYTERATNTAFLNQVLLFMNKKQFKRTTKQYFYRIESVLQQLDTIAETEQEAVTQVANNVHERLTDYTSMRIGRLKRIAKDKNIKIPVRAKKSEIIKLINENQIQH